MTESRSAREAKQLIAYFEQMERRCQAHDEFLASHIKFLSGQIELMRADVLKATSRMFLDAKIDVMICEIRSIEDHLDSIGVRH